MFNKNTFPVGTVVWVSMLDSTRTIGTILGYNEVNGKVVGINLKRQIDDLVIEAKTSEISAIFDV